jgi:hypothetical protein
VKVLDSDKTALSAVIKGLLAFWIVPYAAMLCAGTLAHHHPDLFNWVFRFGYWDWVLINITLTIIRSGKVLKWYLKEEK